jgi:LytS/YehU family sensor histidine kinase
MKTFLAAMSLKRVLIALGLAVIAAAALNPIFITPFPVVLGRLLVVAMVLLVVFTLTGQWQPPGLPSWLAQVVAVVLAAPVATFIVYLPSVGGNVAEVMRHEGRLMGFLSITATALVIAPLLALGALYRERDAQARNQSLRFELEKSTLEKQALDAQIKVLHAQIEPHFLFNTLANVQELVESKSDRAAPVLESLIAYLRSTIPQLDDSNATLGAEASLVRAYLELMHMRMPDRLRFDIRIELELMQQRFPTMALLTLVENAIHHGIDPSELGGEVSVQASRDAATGRVSIEVSDTGVGLLETSVPGTGLSNLRSRLQVFFGPSARLDLLEMQPHGVRAMIVFDPTAAPASIS